MRRAGGFLNFTPGTVAFVHQSALLEVPEGVGVGIEAVVLVQHVAVPINAQRCEVRQLTFGACGRGALRINVIHPHPKITAGAARPQPGQQGGAKVSIMQVTAWRRRVTSSSRHAHHGTTQGQENPAQQGMSSGASERCYRKSGVKELSLTGSLLDRCLCRNLRVVAGLEVLQHVRRKEHQQRGNTQEQPPRGDGAT